MMIFSRFVFPRLISSLLTLSVMAVLMTGCSWWNQDELEEENLSAEEMYQLAKTELDEGNWSEAINRLQQLEARYPYGRYAKQAQLDTVYAQYKYDRHGLAIAAADRYISLHPTDSSVDYALYLKGLASFNERHDLLGVVTGRTDLSERDPQSILDAIEAFESLVTRFPGSRYARDAKKRINYLNTALASREISIARYYFSREAYLAAVNRSKYVLENYTKSAAVEDALGIMVHAYTAMGMADLSTDSRRILASNYPGSAYLESVNAGEHTFIERIKRPFEDLLSH